jgi:hypothetical protein
MVQSDMNSQHLRRDCSWTVTNDALLCIQALTPRAKHTYSDLNQVGLCVGVHGLAVR